VLVKRDSTGPAAPQVGARTAGAEPAAQDDRAARRVAIASAVGTTIEWYDFFIYGTAAALVFGPQFFPHSSAVAGTLAAFATFAVGFVARPLGGIVMGHFGDRSGRKSMLVWSLMLMGAATFSIGLLPTYARIGAWAPLLLVLLRFTQGFALGGEWAGAVLMSVEHAPRARRGLFGSFVALGLPSGIILSNLVFLLVSAVTTDAQFTGWAWRIPFLASAVLVALGLFVRLRVAESPLFTEVRRAGAERRLPIFDVVRDDTRTVLLATGSYVGIGGLGYLVIVYFVSYADRVLGLPVSTVLGLVLVAAVVFAGSIVASGMWSDRLGRRRVMVWGCGALVAWSAVFFPLADTRAIPAIGVAIAVMMVLQGAYLGPQPAVFAELFPTGVRYSGASLSLQLGTILGGGLAPLIATALHDAAHSSWPVTLYAVALALTALLCVRGLEETYRRDLSQVVGRG
jgi:metabolite-proton symporter